jgi:hypothetical protein
LRNKEGKKGRKKERCDCFFPERETVRDTLSGTG